MKINLLLAAGGAICALAAPAFAEQYVDYTPQKGGWQVTMVKVEPSHIDDYLTGLKGSWVPAMKNQQAHGIIDRYEVMVKLNSSDGQGNVLLAIHYPSLAALDPDKARDLAIQKEDEKAMSKEKSQQVVAGYDKYRTFVADDFYVPVDFGK